MFKNVFFFKAAMPAGDKRKDIEDAHEELSEYLKERDLDNEVFLPCNVSTAKGKGIFGDMRMVVFSAFKKDKTKN